MTYGKSLVRWSLATDGLRPEGTAVLVTRDSMASRALSASVPPRRAAKPYSPCVSRRLIGGPAGRHHGGDLLAGGGGRRADILRRVPGVGRVGEVGVGRPED